MARKVLFDLAPLLTCVSSVMPDVNTSSRISFWVFHSRLPPTCRLRALLFPLIQWTLHRPGCLFPLCLVRARERDSTMIPVFTPSLTHCRNLISICWLSKHMTRTWLNSENAFDCWRGNIVKSWRITKTLLWILSVSSITLLGFSESSS